MKRYFIDRHKGRWEEGSVPFEMFEFDTRKHAEATYEEMFQILERGIHLRLVDRGYGPVKMSVLKAHYRETIEETNSGQREALEHMLEHGEKTLSQSLVKWCRKIEGYALNPQHLPGREMEWSQGVFETAANLDIIRHVAAWWWTTPMGVEEIRQECLEHMQRGSRYPKVDNLSALHQTAAWSEMYDDLRWYLPVTEKKGATE